MSVVTDLHPDGLQECRVCRGLGAIACTPVTRELLAATRAAHLTLQEAPVTSAKDWEADRTESMLRLERALIAFDRRSPT